MTQRAWPAWARVYEIVDLLRLSVPIAISRMSVMLMALTDAIVLGQIDEGELPFVLNSWLPIGVALGFGFGLLMGVQVLTSELLGRNEHHQTGRIFRRGFIWSLFLGIFLTGVVYASAQPLFDWIFVAINPNSEISGTLSTSEVADEIAKVTRILALGLSGFMISMVCSFYLEALRRPLLVTWVMYFGVVANLVIDLALVAGFWGLPQLGAEGVAWATTGSRWVITILLLGLVVWLTPALQRSGKGPSDEPRRQLAVGFGTAVSNVAEWGGFNMTYVIASFISLGVNAAYGYTVQVMGVCFMFFVGIGTATSVRVAEYCGRGDQDGVQRASRLGIAATFVTGGFLAIILVLFGPWVARGLVDLEAEIDGLVLAPMIAVLLVYAAVATTFDGLQAVASMALRAQGVIWLPSIIHVGSFFILMIPATYLLGISFNRGAVGMMEGVGLALVIAGGLQWWVLERRTARHIG